MQTRRALAQDLDSLAELFDGYRQFYGQPVDVDGARAFIRDRLTAEDSVILVAEDDQEVCGFAQLYPSLSSVRMGRMFILNDLFVAPRHRGSGVGKALLEAAARLGEETGAKYLTLMTQTSNRTAQSLYEKLGWVRDDDFYTYNLEFRG